MKGNTIDLTCIGLIDDALKSAIFLTQTVVHHMAKQNYNQKIMETNIRLKIIFSIFALLSLVCITSCTSTLKENTSPNIIIFLVDDMGLMDTSVPFLTDSNGNLAEYPLNDYYHTPNMKTLAAQGIRFTNFYAHSVCSPTRTSILTGQNSARHGVTNWVRSEENNRTEFGPTDWNWKGLTKESVTFPRILQQAGYKTIHVGKAHFGIHFFLYHLP